MASKTHSGYVAIVGRPNMGKSTLLNKILKQKVSITSRKPQTTRKQILGIKTEGDCQVIYVDTPGLHSVQKQAINRYMNKAASSAMFDVDVILFMVDSLYWKEDDTLVLDRLKDLGVPVILVLNKADTVKDKKELLPVIEERGTKMQFDAIMPTSAKHGDGVEELEAKIASYMPEAPFYFEEDKVTDQTHVFQAAECIREKIIRNCGQELPYATAVDVEEYKDEDKIVRIQAIIWVERPGQKKIVIGKAGERLKTIGTEARKDIQHIVKKKVYLNLWVKVKDDWSDSEKLLGQLGYRE